MNRKMIVFVLGRIVAIEGIAMILPIITAMWFHEWQAAASFGAVAAGAVVIGILLTILGRTKNNTIYVREGFIVVALAGIGAYFYKFKKKQDESDEDEYADNFDNESENDENM